MNILILIKLLAAHIIGDFFFQTDKICNGKNSNGFKRVKFLIIHSCINAVLAYLFVGMWECWLIPTVVFITHFIIDFIKSYVKKQSTCVFLIDQLAHILVITILWIWLTGTELQLCPDLLSDYRIWAIAVCYMLVLKPASILLGTFIAKWTPDGNDKTVYPTQVLGLAILKEFLY